MRQLTRRIHATWCSILLAGLGLWCGEVGEEIEDVLQIAEDGVVDRQLAVEHFLEIGLDVAEAKVQALKGLELGSYAGGEGADCDVADVAQ